MQIKSVELLKHADCVIYDALLDEGCLSYCRPGADVVYVGKRGGFPSLQQTEIDELLVNKCRQHKHVRRCFLCRICKLFAQFAQL